MISSRSNGVLRRFLVHDFETGVVVKKGKFVRVRADDVCLRRIHSYILSQVVVVGHGVLDVNRHVALAAGFESANHVPSVAVGLLVVLLDVLGREIVIASEQCAVDDRADLIDVGVEVARGEIELRGLEAAMNRVSSIARTSKSSSSTRNSNTQLIFVRSVLTALPAGSTRRRRWSPTGTPPRRRDRTSRAVGPKSGT